MLILNLFTMFSILDEQQVSDFLQSVGEKKYREAQITQALYKDLIENIDDITPLSLDLREKLKQEFFLSSLSVKTQQDSHKDSTTKVAFETHDNLFIESVLMRHLSGRNTLCVSSEVGCPLGCTFCATGKMGFYRNLEWYEIVDQVLYFDRLLKKENTKIRNIVFMGMGEPFLNFDNVIRAIKAINDPLKLGKGSRHITISTSGVIPGILKLIKQNMQVNLAISLHAPNNEVRSKIMPINKKYPLEQLIDSLDQYTKLTKRRIFYEYVMLKGVNDTEENAHELGKLLQGKLAHINLIPWNTVGGIEFVCSKREDIERFQKILEQYHLPSTIRVTLGDDIDAACGQLVKNNKRPIRTSLLKIGA